MKISRKTKKIKSKKEKRKSNNEIEYFLLNEQTTSMRDFVNIKKSFCN